MHQTVLLPEAVAALVTERDGYYVDGTFGRGGHSREILSVLGAGGHLLAVDKDLQAIEVARLIQENETRFDFEHGSFAQLPHQLRRRGIEAVDGILLDLGVSSPQLDEGARGFSFLQDGPLDMRMDTSSGMTAAQWLATVKHGDLARVLREDGEERYAGRIASAILRAREKEPLQTTAQLAQVVAAANPKWEQHKHPATRAFQAIRIYINQELEDLEKLLGESVELLGPGGRLVVISFHSLEDRLVKRFIRRMARGDELPASVPVREQDLNRRLRPIGKAVRPGTEEIAANTRARSAIMRVAEKLPVSGSTHR
ncbi:MAG: 16S rRNA (cytosine(1402)-N(4))-methyltransferase RsmH [Gammaproteobacteria bacterium]|nr:16S rRNA (cytosine(1402)-N(4))-methyltransferase RsmH [Gammaproteobacteria bacterium]